MAKITYVPTRFKEQKIPPRHISMKRLGEIFDCSPQEIEDDLKRRLGETMWTYGIPYAEGIECPFGERNLMDDTCYIGSDVHRCKYFRRYIHDGEHAGTIECCCPKPRIIPEKGKPVQLSLFDF